MSNQNVNNGSTYHPASPHTYIIERKEKGSSGGWTVVFKTPDDNLKTNAIQYENKKIENMKKNIFVYIDGENLNHPLNNETTYLYRISSLNNSSESVSNGYLEPSEIKTIDKRQTAQSCNNMPAYDNDWKSLVFYDVKDFNSNSFKFGFDNTDKKIGIKKVLNNRNKCIVPSYEDLDLQCNEFMKKITKTYYGEEVVKNKNWSYDPTGNCLTKYNGDSYSKDQATSDYTIGTEYKTLDNSKKIIVFVNYHQLQLKIIYQLIKSKLIVILKICL